MDTNKSKLPKPKSRLTPTPLTEVKQNTKPPGTFSRGPPPVSAKFNTRRSKSMVNLKTFTSSRKLADANTVKGTVSSVTTRLNAAKRPAPTKVESEIKPKVPKRQKLPDWDYKGRFQQLNEQHKQLLEVHHKLKDDCADAEQMKLDYDTKLADRDENISKLTQNLNDLKSSYEILESKNVDMLKENDALTVHNKNLKDELEKSNILCNSLEETLSKLRQDHVLNEILRRKLHNTIQDLKGNIRVFCRVRPPINDVESEKKKCWINFVEDSTIELRNSRESTSTTGGKPIDTKVEFTFDRVFDESSTQNQFFEELSQLVQSAIDGYNVCVFAYGQTGSGKTYTMQGLEDSDNLGMIPRSINLIFKTIEELKRYNWKYEVKVSFLEIYNENVRDLLDPNASRNIEILHNEGRETTVSNLKIEPISSYEDFHRYMKIAQKHRAVAATDFNEHSSRSHAITKIILSGKNDDSNLFYKGSVSLVDLAGSESAKTSKGERLVETKNINKSLSALGSVMLALHNKDKHIPYRNSKLTYLLQSSLGGNSKTLMIVNISPFEEAYGESINSLRFASKVKEVKNKVKRNKAVTNE